jgi:hypothetical protein
MKNLAGVKPEASTPATIAELEAAGVSVIPAPDRNGEVLSNAAGRLEVAGHTFTFRRCWVYWAVTASPPLPARLAVNLNDAPPVGRLAYYSGGLPTLGAVVRAHGYAGGIDSAGVLERGDCYVWHIDTQDGLAAFVAWAKSNL